MTTITMDQRVHMSSSMFEKKNEFTDLVDNYVKNGGITRDTGLTLYARNFFTMYDETSIRNSKGFKEYFYSLEYDHQIGLITLFRLMKQDIFLEFIVEKHVGVISVFVHLEPWEEPEFFEFSINDSLVHLLNQYTTRQIHVRTSVEELLLRIMEMENEDI